ncbi:DUF3276 family protein [Spirochaeta lutea]|uniref:DUF3276 family protein n=1 Tax=Spirochaeta lutea TaxID=1480694 RepID=UPI00055A1214|nr:DUF3276 family protein [Spirochaeta lutea]
MGVRGEIFSTRVISDRRTFFFNVKENRRGDKFLNIVESRKNVNEDFDRSQIMIYEEDVDRFVEELEKAVKALKTRS